MTSDPTQFFKSWQPLLDAITAPVCLVDLDRSIIQCNTSFASLVSKPCSEIIGTHYSILIPEEEADGKEATQTPTPPKKTTVHLQGKWFQVNLDTLFDEKTNFRCSIHVFTDLSELKAKEEDASQRNNLLNSIINGTQDGISVLDRDQNVIMVNDQVRSMLPAGTNIERSKCFQVYHNRSRPCENCPSLRAIKSGRPESSDVSFIDKDNSKRTLELRVFPIKDSNDTVTNVVEYVRDISESTKAAQNNKILTTQLESLWRITRLLSEDYAAICQQVLMEMGHITCSPHCFFGFLSDDEETMSIHAWSPKVMADCGVHNQPQDFIVADAGIWAKAVRERRSVIINDYLKDDAEKNGLPEGHLSLSRILAVPGFKDDKITVLGVVANKNGDYTEEDAEALTKFMVNVCLLLEKKHTDIALAEQANLLKIGAEIGRIFTSSNSIGDILQASAESINQYLGAAFTRIWLYDDSNKRLELQASAGIYTHIDGGHRFIPLGKYEIGQIAASRTPHQTNYVIGDPFVHDQEWAKREKLVAFAGHPLLVGKKLIGVLALFSQQPLSETVFRAITSIADEIALGIERIRHEEQLEKSEQQYRRLVENLKEKYFFYIRDSSGNFTYLSPSASHILGHPLEEIMAHSSKFLSDTPINKEVERYTQLCLEGKKQPAYEAEFQHQDGRMVQLEIMESPVFSGESVIAVEGIAHDITVKKRIAQMLRVKNRALKTLSQGRALIRSSKTELEFLESICQVIIDSGGYELAWIGFAENNKEKSILPVAQAAHRDGYLSEIDISWGSEENGKGPTGTATREARTIICRDLQNDAAFSCWRDKALKYGYASSIATPLILNEKTIGNLNIYSAHPHAFNREEVLLPEELAADVASGISSFREKGARLQAEKELLQSQKMDAIGTLAGGIAHDFNNILSPIIGFSQMLLENSAEKSQEKADLEIIYKSALRAKNLVKQILTFSRQESEDQLLPCLITPLIKESLKLLRSSIPSSIEFKQNIHNEPLLVLAQATHIHQIVMNLCTNAFHAMEEKGGTLTVSLREIQHDQITYDFAPKAQSYAELVIEDTGAGIDPAIMEKMFEPYFTTKPQGKGTGLGLSIVYGIIEEIQGEIFFESGIGVGTKVNVFLPITQEERENRLDNTSAPKGSEKILIIDDEEFVARPMALQLSSLGYEVTVSTNSLKALELFEQKQNNIDLVITDQTMPQMTGIQLAEKILQLKEETPIILMTGYTAAIDEEAAIAKGIKSFLLKPISRDELAQTVRALLDGRDKTDTERDSILD